MANAQKGVNTYNGEVNALSGQEAAIQPQIAGFTDAVNAYDTMQAMNPATNLLPVIQEGHIGAIPPTVGLQQYADVQALLNLYGANAPTNLPIDPSTAAMSGTYNLQNEPVPILNNLIDPILNPVAGGLAQAQMVYDAHPNNPALADDIGPYNQLQAAYNALMQAISANAVPVDGGPVNTGGGGGIRPI